MPFLAYFAVLLIAVASAAFGLDLLTAPLPDVKPKAKVARSSAPNAVRQIPIGRTTANADDSDRALSPIYPANPAASHAASLPVQPQAEAAPQQQAEPPPQLPSNSLAPQIAAVQTAAVQNRCAVQACANAYKSFRAQDCSYQPLIGERRLCAISSGRQDLVAAQPQTPRIDLNEQRKRKEAELRDVERRVRALTDRATDDDDGSRASNVVVIDMRDSGYAPPPGSYSRRWQSWR